MTSTADPTVGPTGSAPGTPSRTGARPDAVGENRLGAGSPSWFRPDVDGLRALAIVIVVGFHAGVPGFAGGFVGVDVFFVISGYLITTKLVHETESTGRVHLLGFWAKRVRRLVPAMAVMVLVTLVLSVIILAPREWPGVARSGAAASAYVSNILFATGTTTYFGSPTTENPFLHTWSLGVEEQFYLLWPALIWLAAALALRASRPVRRQLAVILALVVAASLVVSLGLTKAGNRWAFFGLPSRSWQFALAGLTALVVLPAAWQRRSLATASVVGGLAMIIYSVIAFTGADPYPGLRALVPTFGTVLVIVGGQQLGGPAASPVSGVLAHRSLQWLGRVSYSWYLWHWPFMVLASAALATESPTVRLAAGAVALVVAAVMYTKVEDPIRHAAVLRRSLARTFALAGALTALSLLAAFLVRQYADAAREWPETIALETLNQANDYVCADEVVDPSGVVYCRGGDPDGSRTVVLTGDSHAGQWMGAFGAAAGDAGIRLVSRWDASCPAVPVTVTTPIGPDEPCAQFQRDTLALITELQADLVVVTQATSYAGAILGRDGEVAEDEQVTLWATAYEQFVTTITDQGIPVAAVVDTPRYRFDPLACLARLGGDQHRCAATREDAIGSTRPLRDAEAAVRDRLGVPTLDVTDEICDESTCRVVDGTIVIFADGHHLTNQWTLTRQDEIRDFLERSMAPDGPVPSS